MRIGKNDSQAVEMDRLKLTVGNIKKVSLANRTVN